MSQVNNIPKMLTKKKVLCTNVTENTLKYSRSSCVCMCVRIFFLWRTFRGEPMLCSRCRKHTDTDVPTVTDGGDDDSGHDVTPNERNYTFSEGT